MKLLTLMGVVAGLAPALGVSAAETAPPRAVFLEAYVYACQPVEYDFAGTREDLDEPARRVHDTLYVGKYGSSCRDFYFKEVVPRLDINQMPYFVTVSR